MCEYFAFVDRQPFCTTSLSLRIFVEWKRIGLLKDAIDAYKLHIWYLNKLKISCFGGRCSLQGMLTPKLLCCQSGRVDGCGVCDGDGSSCPLVATVQYSEPMNVSTGDASTVARRLRQVPAEYADVADRFKTCMCTTTRCPMRTMQRSP
jgi:hypothetical protein